MFTVFEKRGSVRYKLSWPDETLFIVDMSTLFALDFRFSLFPFAPRGEANKPGQRGWKTQFVLGTLFFPSAVVFVWHFWCKSIFIRK